MPAARKSGPSPFSSIAFSHHSTVSRSIIFSLCSPQSNQTLLSGPVLYPLWLFLPLSRAGSILKNFWNDGLPGMSAPVRPWWNILPAPRVRYPFCMKWRGSVTASGSILAHAWLLSYTPLVLGRSPVIIAARDGQHAGAAQYARLKNIPRLARRSMLGVLIGLFGSNRVVQSFISSIAINRTFIGLAGFLPRAALFAQSRLTAPSDTFLRKSRRFMFWLPVNIPFDSS